MKKVFIEDFRNILGIICVPDLLDENLEEKKLYLDLGMDDIDVTRMSMKIESQLGISLPDSMWRQWQNNLSSITVKQVMDDVNSLA